MVDRLGWDSSAAVEALAQEGFLRDGRQVAAKGRNYQQLPGFLKVFGL